MFSVTPHNHQLATHRMLSPAGSTLWRRRKREVAEAEKTKTSFVGSVAKSSWVNLQTATSFSNAHLLECCLRPVAPDGSKNRLCRAFQMTPYTSK